MQYTDIQIWQPGILRNTDYLNPGPLSCWPPLWIKTSKSLKRGAFCQNYGTGSIFFLSTASQIYLLMVIR
ncbi:hypothetical protein JEB46_003538 [Salmonella enterica]|nr:hypothetical protein [Salmonella enterica]EHJ8700349.1 hypothetical protein [Salmonella enterica subsp. enterica serovar Norwich]EEE3767312.1 hypothetical protein [Salmonella enterica]EEE4045416.1 hypothetical protein [Salmonella enterica]EGS4562876.1 hypothetical protein [Salmonella enterica]